MFSVPLNPKLTPEQFDTFLEFLKRNKKYIYDVYYTSRMAPFEQDAMGDVFPELEQNLISENAYIIPKQTGIPLSATFNNIEVPPTDANLDLFIKNFKNLYDKGIRIVTIPHTLWMLSGKFQRAYPDVLVKNTILRNTQRLNEIVKQVEAGFDYINLDRDLMRNEDFLKSLTKVKEHCKTKLGVDVKISLLANEGCWGNCPVQDEHFLYNNTRKTGLEPTYFKTKISYFSCPKWEEQDPAYQWRIANFPPWKEEWDRLLTYVDVIKMHGRESSQRLFESMNIIDRFREGKEILFPEFEEFINKQKFAEKRIKVWRETIKNCQFNCWDCNVCDKIVEKNNSAEYIKVVKQAITNSGRGFSGITDTTKAIGGLTSDKVKHLVNNICRNTPDPSYLEVGVFQGAIFTSALERNNIIACAVDNWSNTQNVPADDKVKIDVERGKDKQIFLENIRSHVQDKRVQIIDEDLFKVKPRDIKTKANIVFYDCDHTPQAHYQFLGHYRDAIDDTFILIMDDWNWPHVKAMTERSINDNGMKVLFKEEIMTKGEDKDDYWNGVGVFVINQQ